LGLDPGTVVAKRYKVHSQLGKGGMGEVFSAENTRTGRMVAIKVLRAESRTKQSAIERFRREARAAGSINSDFVSSSSSKESRWSSA
jgi:serine/threonine-protein kinase